jgi:hypothetical protein
MEPDNPLLLWCDDDDGGGGVMDPLANPASLAALELMGVNGGNILLLLLLLLVPPSPADVHTESTATKSFVRALLILL